HISQNGRYLALTATLTSGRAAIGFYDLQTSRWIKAIEAQQDEFVVLGARYSSDPNSRIAVSFVNEQDATARAWRVVLFDMTTGNGIDELRSDGPELASFVGAEFLATELTIPTVVLLAQDTETDADQIHIRFDSFEPEDDPFGAVVWYPGGAPGIEQELISSSYKQEDLDLLPNGHAIYAYNEPSFPAGPAAGEMGTITTNTIGALQPESLGASASPQPFYADGVSTVYGPVWASDGRLVMFRRHDATTTGLYWIKLGTAVLIPLGTEASEILGVPTGFVYNTGTSIYFLAENATTPTGPIFSDPMLSGSAHLVWATAFGNPPLALDSLGTATLPNVAIATAVPTLPPPAIITATPDNSACRLASADGSNINIRAGPGTNYPTIGQMSGATELNVTGINGQWYVVNYSGTQGWIAAWVSMLKGNCTALTFVAAPPPPPPTTVPAGVVIEFSADRTNINAGECTNVNWRVENINQVFYQGEGVVGQGSRQECPTATTTYTLSVLLNDGTTQTRTVTITVGGGGSAGQPDLFVSEFALNPGTPTEGQAVQVRVGVYNQGGANADATFHIDWYAGENASSPACSWDLNGMVRNGGRILECTYAGYPSWYATINTKVVVDTYNAVAESNEGNNTYLKAISVNPAGGGGGSGSPDLIVTDITLNPSTPNDGQPVQVAVTVYNQGTAAVSGTSFHIEWYPGENYPSPACAWDLDSMNANGGRVLNCNYAGYPSPYATINTMARVDTYNAVS
ncbi:MAG: hypothetical protein EHM39_05365, partial [Chloroflexi bacterium]